MAVFNFAAIRNHNAAFIAQVSAGLNRLPAELLAVYAVNVLELAVSKAVTKHDSSRFAANFDLMFDRDSYRAHLQPSQYGDHIGEKGDKGAYFLAVLMAKRRHYGYKKNRSGFLAFDKKGMIAYKLRLPESQPLGGPNQGTGYAKGKTIPTVELFNPIMSKTQRRASSWFPKRRDESWNRKGKTYAENALVGGEESFMSQAQGLQGAIGNGYLAARLKELSMELRQTAMKGV
jgi:hypothetical protein